MDDATKQTVSRRWREYGLDRIEKALQPDAWSGQGPAAVARLDRT
jgi:hypothetical protein